MVVYPTTDKSNATNPKPSAPKPPAPQSPTDNQEQPGDNAAPAKEQLSLAENVLGCVVGDEGRHATTVYRSPSARWRPWLHLASAAWLLLRAQAESSWND